LQHRCNPRQPVTLVIENEKGTDGDLDTNRESASTIFRLVQTKTGKFDLNLYNIGKPRILALH
jgi:hypothetical protein